MTGLFTAHHVRSVWPDRARKQAGHCIPGPNTDHGRPTHPQVVVTTGERVLFGPGGSIISDLLYQHPLWVVKTRSEPQKDGRRNEEPPTSTVSWRRRAHR